MPQGLGVDCLRLPRLLQAFGRPRARRAPGHGNGTAREPTTTGDWMEHLARARQVLVAVGSRCAASPTLDAYLAGRLPPGPQVEVLYPFGLDPAPVERWLDQGFHVYDAPHRHRTVVVLDDTAAYLLPDWERMPDAVSVSCALRLQRLGVYVLLDGVVEEVVGETPMCRLRANRWYWTWVSLPAGAPVPKPSDRVRVVALASWVGGAGSHFMLGALLHQLSATEGDGQPAWDRMGAATSFQPCGSEEV